MSLPPAALKSDTWRMVPSEAGMMEVPVSISAIFFLLHLCLSDVQEGQHRRPHVIATSFDSVAKGLVAFANYVIVVSDEQGKYWNWVIPSGFSHLLITWF